jgi:glycosyltransferase involved in cell wall biosynthesis
VEFGRELHRAMVVNGAPSALWHTDRPDGLDWRGRSSGIHLQFTDRLFGTSPQQAAGAVGSIVAAAASTGRRVTVTLHDLPQPSDGHLFGRRKDAYAAVCERVHAVVVSSDHEVQLLAPYRPARVAVVPLPVRIDVSAKPPATESLSVGIFGYVYPGKGHLEVLDAIGRLDDDVELIAVGQASDGHADLVATLEQRARALGVPYRLTGYLTDGLAEVLRGVTVPVAPHRHVSASGSLNNWLGAGRRPLAPVNRYTEEVARRNPDVLELYPDTESGLRTAIKRALEEPALTWLPESTVCTPSVADAADQYARLLAAWHR